jgi:hypothetical protein
VEFATRYTINNVVGELIGPSQPYSAASAAMFSGMLPAFTRNTDLTMLPMTTAAGAKKFEVVASEQWGYPLNGYYGKVAPYLNYTAFDAMMTKWATTVGTKATSWDVWNEPDNPPFWGGTQLQFFQTYLHAYKDIRAALGTNAMIGGPSTTHFDITYIKAMFDFCVANGCQMNFVSWHELAQAPTDISQVVTHVAALRSLIASNSSYQALGIKEIHINETVGMSDMYNPAENLAWLNYLEIAKVDVAARSCWASMVTGSNNCFNSSHEGLVQPGTATPRSVYWVYKLRAGMTNRVAVTSTMPQVVGMAASWPDGVRTTRILLGNYQYPGVTSAANITLKLNHLSQSTLMGYTSARVVVQRIAATGEAATTTLPIVYQATIPILNDQMTIPLPALALHEAYVVTLMSTAVTLSAGLVGVPTAQ